LLAVSVAGCGPTPKVTKVSVASDEAPGTCQSRNPSMSDDARYVAFQSCSSFVTPEGNALPDVFVRDRSAGTTVLVSKRFDGAGTGNSFSVDPAIAAAGRYVVFTSSATNLVAGDTNGRNDVFLRDLTDKTTERISVSSAEVAGNGDSDRAAVSSDGRYVVFDSAATNLVSGDTNGKRDVFLRDRTAGTTTRLSVRLGGVQTDEDSQKATITPDGRFIAFLSADGLMGVDDPPNFADAYVYDRSTGLVAAGSCVGTACPSGSELADGVDLSDDGHYLAYDAVLGGIWRRDLTSAPQAVIDVSVPMSGNRNGSCDNPSISPDGNVVAFDSYANNLVTGDTNTWADVFVRNVSAGTTTRISVTAGGAQATGGNSINPWMGTSPRYIAFSSLATNLVADDTNAEDVFLRDAGA
jgi:Tol biopolymer transport system component